MKPNHKLDMADKLETIGLEAGSFNIRDQEKFRTAIKLLKESLVDDGATLFCSDNLITWNKNLSFLRDQFFLDIVSSKDYSLVEKSIIWRTYILLYFAELAAKLPGDFLELGCCTGHTAFQVIQKIDFKKLGKKYYLYDLFEWKEGDGHSHRQAHDNPNMYEDTKKRFAPFGFVKVIKGAVPESFSQGFPDKICFAHIDMNNAAPEAAALKTILPKLSAGGIIILDDYGWWGYSGQKIALDPIIKENGLQVLELPTGQGLVIKTY